jgi:hypothetical protein
MALWLALVAGHAAAQVTAGTLGLVGDVATVREYHAYADDDGERRLVVERAFDARGVATSHVFLSYALSDGSLRERQVTSFDDEGRRRVTVAYGPDGAERSRTEYDYDAAWRQVSERALDADGLETRRTDVERDAAGNPVLELRYRGDELRLRTERSFDAEGRWLEVRQYEPDGRLNEVRTAHAGGGSYDFELYDGDGEVEERGSVRVGPHGTESMVAFDGAGALAYEIRFTYDADGREVERRDVEADGSESAIVTRYVLDEVGNWTRIEVFEDYGGGLELYEVREREIDYR